LGQLVKFSLDFRAVDSLLGIFFFLGKNNFEFFIESISE